MNERYDDHDLERRLDSLGANERDALTPEAGERIASESAADAAMIARLDALGADERAGFTTDTAARIEAAVGEVFEPAPIPISRGWSLGSVARIGGGIAALVVVGMGVWFGLTQNATVAPGVTPGADAIAAADAAEDLELLLDLWDDDAWSVDLVDLSSDVSDIQDGVDAPWSIVEALEGAEGAI